MRELPLYIAGFLFLCYVTWNALLTLRTGFETIEHRVAEQAEQTFKTKQASLLTLHDWYASSQDEEQRKTLKARMCMVAKELPEGEVPNAVIGVVGDCI